MAKKQPKTTQAAKQPAKKTAKKSAPNSPAKKADKKPSAKQLHLKGMEALADLALRVTPMVQPAGIETEGEDNKGNMSPAEAVIWALNRAVGPPFGPNDSVSGLGITSNGQWEALANDLHTARNSYTLNGAQTRSKLPPAPGDTVSALVGVVSKNS